MHGIRDVHGLQDEKAEVEENSRGEHRAQQRLTRYETRALVQLDDKPALGADRAGRFTQARKQDHRKRR